MSITKRQLEILYIERRHTFRQCAEALGLPNHSSIQRLMKKYNIERRPSGFQVGDRKKGDRKPEDHGSWKGGKKSVPCTQCGIDLEPRFISHIHEKNFCNDACYGIWRSENFKGEANPNHGNSILAGAANPNWQGGIAHEPYASIWGDKRFKAGIRERDNFTCQNPECRNNSDVLTIHHIDYDKKNCERINLITLCNSCNCRANYNREFWQAGYEEIIRLKYESLNQQIAV